MRRIAGVLIALFFMLGTPSIAQVSGPSGIYEAKAGNSVYSLFINAPSSSFQGWLDRFDVDALGNATTIHETLTGVSGNGRVNLILADGKLGEPLWAGYITNQGLIFNEHDDSGYHQLYFVAATDEEIRADIASVEANNKKLSDERTRKEQQERLASDLSELAIAQKTAQSKLHNVHLAQQVVARAQDRLRKAAVEVEAASHDYDQTHDSWWSFLWVWTHPSIDKAQLATLDQARAMEHDADTDFATAEANLTMAKDGFDAAHQEVSRLQDIVQMDRTALNR